MAAKKVAEKKPVKLPDTFDELMSYLSKLSNDLVERKINFVTYFSRVDDAFISHGFDHIRKEYYEEVDRRMKIYK